RRRPSTGRGSASAPRGTGRRGSAGRPASGPAVAARRGSPSRTSSRGPTRAATPRWGSGTTRSCAARPARSVPCRAPGRGRRSASRGPRANVFLVSPSNPSTWERYVDLMATSPVLTHPAGAAGSRIVGLGHHQPAKTLTNEDIARLVETNDEWIRSRTGIVTRHVAADDVTVADMATAAAEHALADAGVAADAVDLVAVATTTAADRSPNTPASVPRHGAAGGVTVAGLAAAAAEHALADAGVAADAVDLVVVATTTAEDRSPNTAGRVAYALRTGVQPGASTPEGEEAPDLRGLVGPAALDVNTACSGFAHAVRSEEHTSELQSRENHVC